MDIIIPTTDNELFKCKYIFLENWESSKYVFILRKDKFADFKILHMQYEFTKFQIFSQM